MESLTDISVFVRVVERGSFTAAAADMDMSKAAVSKYISRLETRLDARLLNRTTRKLSLTEVGEALYHDTRGALAELEAAETGVLKLTGNPRGRLRVTAPPLFGTELLAPRICDFLHAYPEIEFDLDLDNRIVDLVAKRFDVAIRLTTMTDSSLVARRLADVCVVTAASPAYLATHGTPEIPADLRDHQCLGYNLDRTPSEWRYHRPRGKSETIRVTGRFRSNNDRMLKQSALDGYGILRIPEIFIARELREGQLVKLLSAYAPPPVTLAAMFPTRENLAPKVRVFVDFLVEHFSGVYHCSVVCG